MNHNCGRLFCLSTGSVIPKAVPAQGKPGERPSTLYRSNNIQRKWCYFGGLNSSLRVSTLWLFLCGTTHLYGQTDGLMSGLVSDTSQAVIPGVSVTAESPTSGKHRSSVTDSGGHYVIANLPVGTYSVVARKPAFRPARLKEIHVGVAETLTVNL